MALFIGVAANLEPLDRQSTAAPRRKAGCHLQGEPLLPLAAPSAERILEPSDIWVHQPVSQALSQTRQRTS